MDEPRRSWQNTQTQLWTHSQSPFFRAEVEEILAQAACDSSMCIIDVGCGNGFLVATAICSGARALGLEASREIVEAARSLSGADSFIQGTAQGLPFRTGCLDRILAQHVIEHLADPLAALSEWYRVLKPGGRVVVLTPNSRYPDPAVFEDPTHVRIFDPPALASLLKAAGFHLVRWRTIFPYLRGHIVFGLRHRRLFASVAPWSQSGRSLIALAEKRLSLVDAREPGGR